MFLNEYAVLRVRVTVEPGDGAWDLLDRPAEVYMAGRQVPGTQTVATEPGAVSVFALRLPARTAPGDGFSP